MDMDVSDDEQNIPAEQRAARQAVSIVRHESDFREDMHRLLDKEEQYAYSFINDYLGAKADTLGGEIYRYVTVGRAADAAQLWEEAWWDPPLLPYLDEEAFKNGTLPVDALLYYFRKELPYLKAKRFARFEQERYKSEMQERFG